MFLKLKIENICLVSFFVGYKLRKPSIKNDNQDNKGKKMDNSSDTDSSEDAMDDTPSTHFDIFDVLSEANSKSNDTVDAPANQTAAMNSEETETNPDEEATSDEENAESENSSPHEQPSDNSSSKIAKSK